MHIFMRTNIYHQPSLIGTFTMSRLAYKYEKVKNSNI